METHWRYLCMLKLWYDQIYILKAYSGDFCSQKDGMDVFPVIAIKYN